MTPKQEERIRKKIQKIKKGLAADKKFQGGYYHDGSELRYLQPELYLKLKDYKGASNYFKWFEKTFLMMQTILYFYLNGQLLCLRLEK